MPASLAPAPPRPSPLRGLLLLLCGEGFQRVLSFFAIAGLAVRLDRRDYAALEVTLSTLLFATLVVELGLPLLGAREVARDPGCERRLAAPILRLQFCAAALLVAAAWLGRASGLLAPRLASLLAPYATSLLLLPLLLPWAFQGRQAMEWVAAPGVVRQGVFLLLTALLVRDSGDLARLPWLEVAAVAAAAGLAQWAWRRASPPGLRLVPAEGESSVGAGALLREAAPMGASQLLWVLRMFLATLVLWALVAAEEVADYAAAHRVMMVLQAVLSLYFANLYPALSRAVLGPPARLRTLLLQSVAIAGSGALLLALAAAVKAEGILLLIYRGNDLCNPVAAECLRWLVLVLPLLAVRGHARMTLLAFGRGRLELLVSLAGTVVLAVLIPWWTAARGVPGAAQALLAAEAVGLALTLLALLAAWRSRAPVSPGGAVAAAPPGVP
ncbi:MAG: hypothetical protein FJ293_02560 [Planctomycetes bacterium]|nr:hypothetical protein [Planctomycetota bacterium]